MLIETAGKAKCSEVLPQTLPVTAHLSQRPLIRGPHHPYRDASAVMQSLIRCNTPSPGSRQREGRLPGTKEHTYLHLTRCLLYHLPTRSPSNGQIHSRHSKSPTLPTSPSSPSEIQVGIVQDPDMID